MVAFEAKRLGPSQQGLVIPVVLRGELNQWENHYKRKPVDLRVDLPSQLQNVRRSSAIRDVADIITTFVRKGGDPCADCQTFRLKVELGPETVAALSTFTDPNPLAG
jgi:hypothetical protein